MIICIANIAEKRSKKRHSSVLTAENRTITAALKIKPLHLRFEETKNRFFKVLADHYHLLCSMKERYAPTDPYGEWDERFVEAVREITKLEYVMDAFLNGDLETQVDIINDYGRKIADYERRDKELAVGKTDGTGTDNVGNGKNEGKTA